MLAISLDLLVLAVLVAASLFVGWVLINIHKDVPAACTDPQAGKQPDQRS